MLSVKKTNSAKKNEDKMTKKKHITEEIPSENETKETAVGDETTESSANPEVDADPVLSLKQEIEALNDKYLRINAEYQNYRKRVEKEKSDIFKFGNEKILSELLPVMDNFERALAVSDIENSDSKVLDGIKMIKKNLDEFFERNGIKKIEAVNQPFDPVKHHAVMTVEAEEGQSEVVIEVFQDGYVLNDKVIRPSMVKVAN